MPMVADRIAADMRFDKKCAKNAKSRDRKDEYISKKKKENNNTNEKEL